jgi:signal transduction histidine kinase
VRRRLSIGAQWTLRYTLALVVTVTIFAAFIYSQIWRRTERDARVWLSLQVKDLAEAVARYGHDSPAVARALETSVAVAEDDFKLGLQVFDRGGNLVLAGGSLVKYPLALPAELLARPEPIPIAEGEPPARLFREVETGEHYPYLVLALPVNEAFVQGSIYKRKFVRNARDVRNIYFYSAPALLLVTAAIGYGLARGSLRPIQQINTSARRISGTNLEETIPTTGSGDELDELANTLNDMMERIRQGVGRMRRFTANAAHELRTPLNAIRSRLEVTLEKDRDPQQYRQILLELAAEVESLSDSVHGLMRLAQSEAGLAPEQRVPVDLVALISEVVEFFGPLGEEAGVELHARLDAPVIVPGDRSWLHQLFANLVHNGLKYTPRGGRVSVEVLPEADRVGVRVADTGIGVAPEEADRIFEPFHRVGARPDAPGVGLGLPLAREIARAHGGEIQLESAHGVGSTFVVWLPLDGGAA